MGYGRRYYRRWPARRTYARTRRRHRHTNEKAADPLISAVVLLGLLFVGAVGASQAHPAAAALLGSAILVTIAAAIFVAIRRRLQLRRAYRAIDLAQIDSMSGPEFENYMVKVFLNLRFGVRHVGRTGDQGCDLILARKGRRVVCQLKRYAGPVSNSAVQEAVAAVRYYNCDSSMVVTNSHFTKGARALATRNDCELIDRPRLGIMVASLQQGRRP